MIEYLGPFEVDTYQAKPKARPITKAEVTAVIDAYVKKYAAEHKVSYPDAFSAVRDESPDLIRLWRSMK